LIRPVARDQHVGLDTGEGVEGPLASDEIRASSSLASIEGKHSHHPGW
jgi:hypothetical protein